MAGLSHKDTILIWNDAVLTLDKGAQHYDAALKTLQTIENPAAKILFNIGHVNLSTGHLNDAMEAFKACTEKDPHLAIAHFQLGLCYYRKSRQADSKTAYEKAIKCLRGNKYIDYKQLGMVYKLYECEVKYNMALAYSEMLQTPDLAIEILQEALQGKTEAKHNVIGTAITKLKNRQSFDPFTIPSNLVFRPPPSKVANLKNIDYLGTAKVVSQLTVPDGEKEDSRSRGPSPSLPSKPPPINTFRPISPNPQGGPPSTPPPLLSPPSGSGGRPVSPGLVKLKDNLIMWSEGVTEYDNKNYTGALDCLLRIEEPSAKILFNMAALQVRLGQTDTATKTLQSAVSKDQHLAIAHCLLANLYCKVNRADDAWRTYEKCLECFRSNKSIDYKQLGMSYKLYQCEVLHNQAYTYVKMGEMDWCSKLLQEAQKCKLEDRHKIIDTSLDNFKQGTLFKIIELPFNLLFKPPKDKVANLKKQDYLGKQKVVSELKPPTPPAHKMNSKHEEGELYLPMAPGPIKHENTYHPPVLPPKPASPLPSAPRRSSSLMSDNSDVRSPSPRVLDRKPPSLPPPSLHSDSFDSDSFDEDGFEDEYRSKPLPVPGPGLSRRFSASNPLPPTPASPAPGSPHKGPPARPLPSPVPSISPRASPVALLPDRPVPQPPRAEPPRKPLPSPDITKTRKISVPLPPSPDITKTRKISVPLPPSPDITKTRNISVPSPDVTRTRKISAPPARPVPQSPRSSPLPDRPVPPPPGLDSPSRQRKVSTGPPPKPVPPNPNRSSPGLPMREPPAPPRPQASPSPKPIYSKPVPPPPSAEIPKPIPSKPVPPPPSVELPKPIPSKPVPPPPPADFQKPVPSKPVPAPPSIEVPQPPSKGLPPLPSNKALPLRPTKQLANGAKNVRHQKLEQRLSTTHVVAIETFATEEEGMLGFGTGELIQVISEVDDNWLEGELRGVHGIFPRNFVKGMSLPDVKK